MKYTLVTMPIKVLYSNSIKLGDVLAITHLLLRFKKSNKCIFDIEKYIKEVASTPFLYKFTSNKKFFEYAVKNYTSIYKVLDFIENSDNETSLRNDMFIGVHQINIDTFLVLNEKLWPDLLQVYISYILDDNIEEGNVEVRLTFDLKTLKEIYKLNEEKDLIDKFISDLDLYLVYNQIGTLLLSKGSKVTDTELYLEMLMYI